MDLRNVFPRGGGTLETAGSARQLQQFAGVLLGDTRQMRPTQHPGNLGDACLALDFLDRAARAPARNRL